MANIYLQPLYMQKEREFGTAGAGIPAFKADFIDATNRAINLINRLADLETRITRITDIEDTVSLDEKYDDVLSDGISVSLMILGRRPAQGAEAIISYLEDRFRAGINEIRIDIQNIALDADISDNEDDFAGLGALN